MLCTRCKTDFCYKCGDRLRQVKFFGDHYSRLSVLGCKYRYKPDKPLQRKLIRGTVFGSKLMLLPVLSTVCLCAGAVVLALGIAALPLFGGMRVYRRIRYPTHRRANRANGTTAAHRSFAGAGRQYPVRERTVEERALDEDVWNRTIQLYNNRLRNRSNERMIRRPQVGEMHDANNNNGNSIATQTTPMTSRSFQFSWFDSSLMLDGADLEFEGDAQYHHNGGDLPHDLVSEIFHIEDIDIPEDGRIFCSLQDESLNLKRTSEMKPYNSHSGRNPVVLKFTEQDLHEIIDDNYQHDNLTSSRQQQLHRHRSGKLKASKAKKPKEVKQTKTKKGTSEGELENGKATGESSKASETAVSSVSTVELPNGRKSAMGTLMRKFTINRNTK